MKLKNKLTALICLSAITVFSQNKADNDQWVRASMASFNEEQFSINFQTPYGKASGIILLKAHRELLPYPNIPVKNIPEIDREKYFQLLSQLQQLRDNPPSWDNIVSKEGEKYKAEFDPPTPPVFAGDQKVDPKIAEKYKNFNRHSSGISGTRAESSTTK